jgi:hypothetical protein
MHVFLPGVGSRLAAAEGTLKQARASRALIASSPTCAAGCTCSLPASPWALSCFVFFIATPCRALMFDREIRGQLAMLMGGRAAEELTCDAGGSRSFQLQPSRGSTATARALPSPCLVAQ